MRPILALMVVLIAGCSNPPTAPAESAGPAAADDIPADARHITPPAVEENFTETLYFVVPEAGVYLLSAGRVQGNGIGGPVALGSTSFTSPEFSAETGSRGHPAGSAVEAFINFSCEHPATLTFRMDIFADGELVASPQGNHTFVGTFFPVVFVDEARFQAVLQEDIPKGAKLSAVLTVEGCAFLATIGEGDWSTGFDVQDLRG